jgi:tripartite ATP-independent transporter DctP family solute receptor
MRSLTRRQLAGMATALPLLTARRSRAAAFNFKFGTNVPLPHPLNIRAQQAADRIATQTDGAVEIRIVPASQLGTDTDMLSQIRSGGIDFMTLSGLILSSLVPVASINGIGFALKSYDQVWPAMDGALGTLVRDEIAKRGLLAFDRAWDNGFRQITTGTRPINTPADLRGLKLRVPVSPLWTSLFSGLGAAPASINLSEVYAALQTRIVDGQENSLALIDSFKMYEVQKYCSLTNHMWDGYWLLANRRNFDRLPQDVARIVVANFNAAALLQRVDVAALNGGLQSGLEAAGMICNPVDPEPFRRILQDIGFYKDWRARYGEAAWKVLDEAVGGLN